MSLQCSREWSNWSLEGRKKERKKGHAFRKKERKRKEKENDSPIIRNVKHYLELSGLQVLSKDMGKNAEVTVGGKHAVNPRQWHILQVPEHLYRGKDEPNKVILLIESLDL